MGYFVLHEPPNRKNNCQICHVQCVPVCFETVAGAFVVSAWELPPGDGEGEGEVVGGGGRQLVWDGGKERQGGSGNQRKGGL